MRVVGNSQIALPNVLPSAAALHQAAVHQATAMALMRVASSGVHKGVYRFATHEAVNRASDEALTLAIALNVQRMATPP